MMMMILNRIFMGGLDASIDLELQGILDRERMLCQVLRIDLRVMMVFMLVIVVVIMVSGILLFLPREIICWMYIGLDVQG